jgi:hypothetical protein
MQPRTSAFKRLMFAFVMLSVALSAFAVPVASAHHASSSGGPLGDAYPCQQTAWVTGVRSDVQQFSENSGLGVVTFDLQAKLNVLIDPTRDGLFCDQIQTQGTDTLYQGCVTFKGGSYVSKYTGAVFSEYSVLHCSALTYNLYGPKVSVTCETGHGYFMLAVAYTLEFSNDIATTTHWNC